MFYQATSFYTAYTASWDTSKITSSTDFDHAQACPAGLTNTGATHTYGTVAQRCPTSCTMYNGVCYDNVVFTGTRFAFFCVHMLGVYLKTHSGRVLDLYMVSMPRLTVYRV